MGGMKLEWSCVCSPLCLSACPSSTRDVYGWYTCAVCCIDTHHSNRKCDRSLSLVALLSLIMADLKMKLERG
jgi:hypothetical protein